MADPHDWITPILDAVVDHALRTGRFERVNRHEPVSPPGSGLTAAVWVQRVVPPRLSGLQATSALVVLTVRLFGSAVQEPRDAIDPTMVSALSALLDAYHGDFQLGGLVRHVDIFGAGGFERLAATAGYLDNSRIYDVTLPMIINDVWSQSP